MLRLSRNIKVAVKCEDRRWKYWRLKVFIRAGWTEQLRVSFSTRVVCLHRQLKVQMVELNCVSRPWYRSVMDKWYIMLETISIEFIDENICSNSSHTLFILFTYTATHDVLCRSMRKYLEKQSKSNIYTSKKNFKNCKQSKAHQEPTLTGY